MDAIEEVKENETEEASGQFSVRKYLDSECELMLKAIQRCDLDGFLDIFQDFPEV